MNNAINIWHWYHLLSYDRARGAFYICNLGIYIVGIEIVR